jgi:endonuclease G
MNKYVIPVLIGVIIILICIAQCNGCTSDADYKAAVADSTQQVLTVDDDEEEDEENIMDVSGKVYSLDSTSLELPRLTIQMPEQLLARAGYSTSYNKDTRNPNWVAWHLTKEHTNGDVSRKGFGYMPDEEVGEPRQELEDWPRVNCTYDHGHMCPAADNKWSYDAMYHTFLLTNFCPQDRDLNGGDWEKLENRCRGWARHYGDVYIACGPVYNSKNYKTLGQNKIAIPDAFFKVVLCMKGKKPKALGFIYPNEGTHHKMDYYVKTVDEVERITGMDFFYNLPDSIENDVESHVELDKW